MSVLTRTLCILLMLVPLSLVSADEHQPRQSSVVLDENLWVTFYDLPSRRFGDIRTALVNGDIDAAVRNLDVTANYLAIESERASGTFREPLFTLVERLRVIRDNASAVTLQELDGLFGRTHWLLAQHYLEFARTSRDAGMYQNTGLYLRAATHHLERAVLWSNTPITREVRNTLQDLRDAATQMRDPDRAADAMSQRPVVRAERLLRRLGEQIDRQVLLPPMGQGG